MALNYQQLMAGLSSALDNQQRVLEHWSQNLNKRYTGDTWIEQKTDEDLQRFNQMKDYLKSKGTKFVEDYSTAEGPEGGKEISRRGLWSIVVWKPKFIKQSSKCIKCVQQYIESKTECIMFYKMTNHCVHQQNMHHYSVIQCIQSINNRLTDPLFGHNLHEMEKLFTWMDELNVEYSHPFCNDCI
eukprot:322933_1